MIEQFVQMAAQKLGISESTAKSATAAVLQFIQKQMGDGEGSKLLGQLGGVSELMNEADSQESSGGMLGGLMQAAGSLTGGDVGSALEVTGKLKDAGLNPEQGTSLVTMLIDWIKEQAGPELVETIFKQAPALKQLAGIQ